MTTRNGNPLRFTRRPDVSVLRRRLGDDPKRIVNEIRHRCTNYPAVADHVFASDHAEYHLAWLFREIAELDPELKPEATRQWRDHCQRLAA